MSRIEKGFMPLPKVEQEQPLDRLQMSLQLPPFVDKDRIGVNLRGIEGLCKLVGIRELRIVGRFLDNQEMEEPTIVGMNPDGSAVSGKIKTQVSAQESGTESKSSDSMGDHKHISIDTLDLGISLDLKAISLRINDDQKPLNASGSWTPHVNNAIKKGIVRDGTSFLVKPECPGEYIFIGLYSLDTLAIMTGSSHSLTSLIASSLVGQIVLYRRSPETFRPSLLIGPQIDRAVLLNLVGRARTLVKDLHPDKK